MTLAHDLGIVHLLEAPGAVDTLAEWFADEWAPWYGPGGEGDAEGDLAACRSRDALPICLVALSESGDVLGTASLRSESVGSELGVGPWLAAVLVPREHQGQGVGTALVAAIEAEARRLGFECLYTSTSTAEGLLKRRGWEAFGASQSLRGPVAVYRRRLGVAAP